MLQQANENQKIQTKQVPLLVLYHNQLESFKQQRDNAQIQFQQAQGAIFACEQMIKQYEDSVKQAAEKFAMNANSLMPNENLGEINDGQAKFKTEKQAS